MQCMQRIGCGCHLVMQQVTQQPSQKDLALDLTFDDRAGHDYSGHDNHLASPHTPGPAQFGQGNSAFLDGNTGLKIKSGNAFGSRATTIAFWIFLLEDSKGAWRSIVSRGGGPNDHTPEIMLWPKERRVHARRRSSSHSPRPSLPGTPPPPPPPSIWASPSLPVGAARHRPLPVPATAAAAALAPPCSTHTPQHS